MMRLIEFFIFVIFIMDSSIDFINIGVILEMTVEVMTASASFSKLAYSTYIIAYLPSSGSIYAK